MKKLLLALGILTILFYSCEKIEDESTRATRDHLFAEQTFNDVGRIVEDGFIENNESKNCPSYTLINTNTTDQDTMIIDYGNSSSDDCISYGNIRTGKIIVIYTGKYRDSLAVITTTFDNYHVNNNLIQGERIVANQGRNSSGNMWFTIDVNHASIANNNGTIDWNATRTREWVSGSTTDYDISDDQYKITGSANGIGVNNNSFTMEITDTLNVDWACFPSCVIKSGKAKITPNGYTERTINYGDGICDCNFDVTINGSTYPIVVN